MTTPILKPFIILLLLICTSQLHAQPAPKDITGTWLCKEASFVSAVPPGMNEEMTAMKAIFTNAKFIFKPTGLFALEPGKGNPELIKEMEFLNNKKWTYDAVKKTIIIGTTKESITRIDLNIDNGTVNFLIYETPLSLKMEKQ